MKIDKIIPIDKILSDAESLLKECGWIFEVGDKTIRLPIDLNLEVQTRAYVLANAPDIFLGNHYEAVILLGVEKNNENWIPKYGYLKLYYDESGKFISEDKYSKDGG
jgi:hypothetical protein